MAPFITFGAAVEKDFAAKRKSYGFFMLCSDNLPSIVVEEHLNEGDHIAGAAIQVLRQRFNVGISPLLNEMISARKSCPDCI